MTTSSDKTPPLPERPETGSEGQPAVEAPPAAPSAGEAAIEVEVGAPEAAGPDEGKETPEADEVQKLRLELELSQEHARVVYGRLKEEHERLLRAAADHENYKKRAAREREEVVRYGNERLVKEILPALDNLDRALAAAATSAAGALASGGEMTRRLLEEALGRFGVKGFSAKGQHFDPRFHEALMSVATEEVPPGTVVEEQQRGFLMHDRLIRPAAVVVSVAPPREPDPPAEPEVEPAPGSGPEAGGAAGGGGGEGQHG